MERAQRDLVSTLLKHIRSLGLISNYTYSGAMDLVHSATDFPEFFRYPAGLGKGADGHEHTQDTQ